MRLIRRLSRCATCQPQSVTDKANKAAGSASACLANILPARGGASWLALQLLRQSCRAAVQPLVQAVLDILGLSSNAVGLHTSLAGLGLDSMQVVSVRSAIQLALNVSYPLSEVSPPHLRWPQCPASTARLGTEGRPALHLDRCMTWSLVLCRASCMDFPVTL